MRRREFRIAAGLLLVAAAADAGLITMAGGRGATVGSAGDAAQQDWELRSGGPGVVWAHDFTYEDEVHAFNDRDATGTLSWVEDGANGHALELTIPTGGVSVGGWWRPFSALEAGDNGLPTDDPAANGTVPLRTDWFWTPGVDSGTAADNWIGGIYAHADYHGNSDINPALTANDFDGTSFYIQFFAKIQATRWTDGNPAGKLAFISSMRKSNPSQEIVIQSENKWQWVEPDGADTNIYRMYTNNGSAFNSFLTDPQDSRLGAEIQPNGPYEDTCQIGQTDTVCWLWPADTWVSLLIKVTPGHQTTNGTLNDPAAADTGIEVWAAYESDPNGGAVYTKIWEKIDYIWQFGGASTPAFPEDSAGEGFNGFIASGYMNAVPSVEGWYQRFDQIIFSHDPIPVPTVWP